MERGKGMGKMKIKINSSHSQVRDLVSAGSGGKQFQTNHQLQGNTTPWKEEKHQ